MILLWLTLASLALAHDGHGAPETPFTGPAATQRAGVGPADACGRVTELDYYNEKRSQCDDQFPRPTPLGEPLDTKAAGSRSDGLLPEMRAIVPVDLTLCRKDQQDLLWFSAGIANVGDGPLQIRPGNRTTRRPENDAWIERDQLTDLREAVQWILSPDGQVAQKAVVGTFGWHQIHNHYHTDAMALYEIRKGSPDGELVSKGRKISFCLDDSYQHGTASSAKPAARTYDEYCRYPQGVSPGWADEYPYMVAGQYVEVPKNAEPGDYYLVFTVNPDRTVREKTDAPSTAWVRFTLKRPKGKIPVAETTADHSPCESPGLCGDLSPATRGANFFRGITAPTTYQGRLQLLRQMSFCD